MGVIIRQSIKGTFFNYLGTAIGAFTTFFVITKVLTTEEIGLTRVLIDAATLLAGLAQLGTNSSIIRYYPFFKNPNTRDYGFFFWTITIPLLGFIIYALFFWIFRDPITNLFIEKSELFVNYYNLIFPLSFFILYLTIFETNANVLMRIAIPKFTREVLIRLLTLLTYILYTKEIVSFNGFIHIFCGVYGVAAIVNIIYLFSLKKISLRPNLAPITKAIRKDYYIYTAFLITAALSGTITPFINSLFISMKMGLNYTGIFTIATYIAALVEIPYRSLVPITRPVISQAIKENNYTQCNSITQKVALHQLLAGSFIFFVIWINIDLVFTILPNGEQFEIAKYVFLVLGFTRLVFSTMCVTSSVLSYSKFYYYSLIFTIVLTFTAIFLNVQFIPKWGMIGAAIASLIAYILQFSLQIALIYAKIKVSPFCWAQLKIVTIMIGLIIINLLWNNLLSPIITLIPLSELIVQCIDAVLKTSTFTLIGAIAIFKWNISEEVNNLISKYIPYLSKKQKVNS